MGVAEVFVDTAGFLALWDAADEHHLSAVELLTELVRKRRHFVTSDFILDETATLLLVRHSHKAARDFLQTMLTTETVRVEWTGADRFHAAAEVFSRHDDKQWSFTDCCSFALMRELRISEAFTTDRHFTQAGFVPLLPGTD